jgi:hypothetical protein
VRNGLGDERDQAGARPWQPLADESKRTLLVASQRDEAQRRQRERRCDPPAGERADALTELAVGDLLQRPIQDQDGEREQAEPEDRWTILPDSGQHTGQPDPVQIRAVWHAWSRHWLFDRRDERRRMIDHSRHPCLRRS